MTALPGETQKDPSTLSYSAVIKWKDYLDAGREIPFATPREEFIKAANCPTQYQLMQRWENLPEYWDIPALFSNVLLPFERQRWQLENLGKQDLDFLLSDKARELRHIQNVTTVQKGIQEIAEMLDTGVYKYQTKEGSQKGGFFVVDKETRLSPNQIARLRITQAALIKLSATLDGQASEIVLHQHSAVGVLERAMRVAMAGTTDKDGFSIADLEAVAGGDKPIAALLPGNTGDVLPADFVPSNVIESGGDANVR